jgi:hypothetical protein
MTSMKRHVNSTIRCNYKNPNLQQLGFFYASKLNMVLQYALRNFFTTKAVAKLSWECFCNRKRCKIFRRIFLQQEK